MPPQDSGRWAAADAYERYMGRWSRAVAERFVERLDAAPGARWIELGCGTGELTARLAARVAPSALVGLDTSAPFVELARRKVPEADLRVGDATATGLPDASFDHAVSGLVLNFLPDPVAGLREMARLVRSGGQVALYVWDYAGHMQSMRHFFDAARTIDPGSAAHDDGVRAPVCRPRTLVEAFAAAGLPNARIDAIDVPAAFADFDDYWTPFLGGAGSAPRWLASVDTAVRDRVRDAVRERLPTGPDGEILLALRAWGAIATVPRT
jgi:trans-aconitate methyltransferase